MLRALLLLSAVVVISANYTDILQVPQPVMDFILGCDRQLRGPKIPVSRTDIDPITGKMTEHISLMNLKQLKNSLHKSFERSDVVDYIVSEIEQSLTEQEVQISGKGGSCAQVTIDVPPQNIKDLDRQLQAVIHQNNQQLLQQVNTLFTYKLNSLLSDIKNILALPRTRSDNNISPLESAVLKHNLPIENTQHADEPVRKPITAGIIQPESVAPVSAIPEELAVSALPEEVAPVVLPEEPEEPETVLEVTKQDGRKIDVTKFTPLRRRLSVFRRVNKPRPHTPKEPVPVVEEVNEEKPQSAPPISGRRRRIQEMLATRRRFLSERQNNN